MTFKAASIPFYKKKDVKKTFLYTTFIFPTQNKCGMTPPQAMMFR